MLFDLEDIKQTLQQAERQQGFLTFQCETLGYFEGAEAAFEGPIRAQTMERAKTELQTAASVMDRLIGSFTGDMAKGMQSANAHIHAERYWENVSALVAGSSFRRSLAALNEQELTVLKATCVHTIAQAENNTDTSEFFRFFLQLNAKLVWAGGQGQFIPDTQAHKFPKEAAATEEALHVLMRHCINKEPAPYLQEIAEMLSQYVQVSQMDTRGHDMHHSRDAIARVVGHSSASWATPDHIQQGQRPFKEFEHGHDLLLGFMRLDDGILPIGFSGNESLVTIAQPGAGKTQCHILPNLLSYEGSLVVLDPKLELLELSAGYRHRFGNRVLILNLADDGTPTHRFNVMEFVDTRPDFIWGSVIELAEFLIPESKGDSSPIFRNKAAELFAVCLGGTILDAQAAGETPTLTSAVAKVFSANETLKNFLFDTMDRAEDYGAMPLAQSAGALASLLNNEGTVEDFQRFQSNASSALMKYRGGIIDRVANDPGDWKPDDLRDQGTTLYIRIPYEEMQVYGGFVSLVLYILTKHLRKGGTEKGELPITFLLDEVAQLGNMDHIANVIETGRGYGLRVWIILQDEEQARAACSKPNLILKTPKVRMFMNPSLETARDMSEELGKINNILNGTDKPIADAATLMGPEFKDDVVALSSGSYPMRLQKHFAYTERGYDTMTSLPYTFTKDGRPPQKSEVSFGIKTTINTAYTS